MVVKIVFIASSYHFHAKITVEQLVIHLLHVITIFFQGGGVGGGGWGVGGWGWVCMHNILTAYTI